MIYPTLFHYETLLSDINHNKIKIIFLAFFQNKGKQAYELEKSCNKWNFIFPEKSNT